MYSFSELSSASTADQELVKVEDDIGNHCKGGQLGGVPACGQWAERFGRELGRLVGVIAVVVELALIERCQPFHLS